MLVAHLFPVTRPCLFSSRLVFLLALLAPVILLRLLVQSDGTGIGTLLNTLAKDGEKVLKVFIATIRMD